MVLSVSTERTSGLQDVDSHSGLIFCSLFFRCEQIDRLCTLLQILYDFEADFIVICILDVRRPMTLLLFLELLVAALLHYVIVWQRYHDSVVYLNFNDRLTFYKFVQYLVSTTLLNFIFFLRFCAFSLALLQFLDLRMQSICVWEVGTNLCFSKLSTRFWMSIDYCWNV